ncbi:MAG: dockerin type I domain-containing protein [Porcipelethomonas sp.]
MNSLDHVLPYEQEFVEYINDNTVNFDGYDAVELKHVYSYHTDEFITPNDIGLLSREYIFDEEEEVKPDLKKARVLVGVIITWNRVYSTDEMFYKNHSVDELNDFLDEKNMKAHFEPYEDDGNENFHICYDEDATEEDIVSAFLSLYKEYGMHVSRTSVSATKQYFEEPEITTTAPVTTSPETTSTTVSITVSDPEQEQTEEYTVRDCAFIAQMLAEGRSQELPETADFNGDGKINIRDAAALAYKLAGKITE